MNPDDDHPEWIATMTRTPQQVDADHAAVLRLHLCQVPRYTDTEAAIERAIEVLTEREG